MVMTTFVAMRVDTSETLVAPTFPPLPRAALPTEGVPPCSYFVTARFLALRAWLLPSTVGPLFFATVAFGVLVSGKIFYSLCLSFLVDSRFSCTMHWAIFWSSSRSIGTKAFGLCVRLRSRSPVLLYLDLSRPRTSLLSSVFEPCCDATSFGFFQCDPCIESVGSLSQL